MGLRRRAWRRTNRRSHPACLSLPSQILLRSVLPCRERCHSPQKSSCSSCCSVQSHRRQLPHLLPVSQPRCRWPRRQRASFLVVSVQCAREAGQEAKALHIVSGRSIHFPHHRRRSERLKSYKAVASGLGFCSGTSRQVKGGSSSGQFLIRQRHCLLRNHQEHVALLMRLAPHSAAGHRSSPPRSEPPWEVPPSLRSSCQQLQRQQQG